MLGSKTGLKTEWDPQVLTGYEGTSKWEEASHGLVSMQTMGIESSTEASAVSRSDGAREAWAQVLSACGDALRWEEAWRLLWSTAVSAEGLRSVGEISRS